MSRVARVEEHVWSCFSQIARACILYADRNKSNVCKNTHTHTHTQTHTHTHTHTQRNEEYEREMESCRDTCRAAQRPAGPPAETTRGKTHRLPFIFFIPLWHRSSF